MKKGKILFLGLLAIILFIGFGSVDAKTIYTEYKKGDKITVNVSKNQKIEFYVVSDSTIDESTVEAIMANTSYPTVTTYENINSTLSNYTSSWTNIEQSKISIPSMSKLIGIDASTINESGKFNEPKYAITTTSYWLSDLGTIQSQKGHWVIGSNLDNEGTYGVFFDTQEMSIRPLINVDKVKVEGGSTISEDDAIWTEFVEKFKNTELLKSWKETTIGTYNITSTDNTLKIDFTNDEGTLTTNFTYANGVIKFIPSKNSDNNSNIIIDQMLVANCIHTIAELKGYDVDKVTDWVEKNGPFKLENDGLELKKEEVTITGEDDAGTTKITVDKILSFSLDIKNGLKTYNNTNDIVVNPKTGDLTKYIVLGLGISIILGAVAYTKSKKYN